MTEHWLKEVRRHHKDGTYLLEAAITLPVLLVSIISMILIIQITALCENVTYETALAIHDHNTGISNSVTILNAASLCNDIRENVSENCKPLKQFTIETAVMPYDGKYTKNLFYLSTCSKFRIIHLTGIQAMTEFHEKVLFREFTGTRNTSGPLETSAFTNGESAIDVIIFPKYGERFHISSCYIVKEQENQDNHGVTMDRNDAIHKGYTPCKVCGGGVGSGTQ